MILSRGSSPRQGIAAATPLNVAPFSGLGGMGRAEVHRRRARPQTQRLRIPHSTSNRFTPTTSKRSRFASCAVDRSRTPIEQARLNVAIVSEDVAARTWPGEDPVGKRLKMGGPDSADPWRTVVGVAEPTRYRELAARAGDPLPSREAVLEYGADVCGAVRRRWSCNNQLMCAAPETGREESWRRIGGRS